MNRSLVVRSAMSCPAGTSSCDAAASFARASLCVLDPLMDALFVASIIIIALIAMIGGQLAVVLSVVAVVLAVVVRDEKKNT